MADILETPENAAIEQPGGAAGAAAPAPPPAPSSLGPQGEASKPATNTSLVKKAMAYSKKNWWLILLPLPIIAIVVVLKHRKK